MIACVYCGGRHARPAEVKRCWAEHQAAPGDEPTDIPTDEPTDVPTDVPTDEPTDIPTDEPTDVPTDVPTDEPTDVPTDEPTDEPAPARDVDGSVDLHHALHGVDDPAVAPRIAERSARSPTAAVAAPVVTPVVAAVGRGPDALGRRAVVGGGAPTPPGWEGADRVVIGPAELDSPAAVAGRLRSATAPLVIELSAPLGPTPDGVERRAPHELGPAFAFELDELRHLVWSNAVDLREPETPGWWLVDAAVALGARVGGPADVVLADGRPVWLDGGPVRRLPPLDGHEVVHAVQVEHGRTQAAASTTDDVAGLAPDQLAAVLHPGGAARIIAPAGSGKTRVLTERARHLLDVWHLPPGAVALVAFNKRAQEEMRERTADLRGLQVRTLNSIALAIVNGTPPFAPQPRRWRTVDEPDVRRILQRFVSTPRRRNTDPLAPWIDALSLVRLGLVDPAEVEARYGGDVDGLDDVFPHYLAALEQAGAVDFDGQIDRAIRVLLTDPVARAAAQRASRVLLVDEFQDLTPAHLLLVRLLAAPGGAVFGVGDDDQTIYGYNGADPAWLIDFGRWFPGAGDHPLEVNYRCPAGVVEVADRLLRHNRRRVDKTIRAASTVPGGWRADASDDPVGATAAAVTDAIKGGASPSEVAVLTRVNATIAPVQAALVAAGVPITGGVGTEFADRTAVRAALAWLRLALADRFAPDDLGEALRRPSRPLHPRIGEWVTEQRDVEALRRLADRLTNDRDAQRVGELADDVERLRALAGATTSRLFDVLFDDIGLGGAVATLDHTRRGMNRSAQGDDLVALRQLARLQPEPAGFERWLRGHLATPRDPEGVVLATVHRVKGQEWPHVVVHLADEEQFPHRLADDVEEERRLFHVAITRARGHVTVVSGDSPSPFVAELTTEPSASVGTTPPADAAPPAASRPARSAARAARDAPDHPLLDRERVMAVPGLVLVDQGHEWVVSDLEPTAAVAERNGAVRRFRIGSKVETAGRQRGTLSARTGDVEAASVLLFDRLRSFRDTARQGKPAYTVFDDKTLAAIAATLPTDLEALARVRGVGPAKLEQYGDDVLTLVTEVVDPDP